MKSIVLSSYPIESVEVNNLKYSYVIEGQGEVVFFLHGFPDHAGSWDKIIEPLSKNFTCIAPFLRGYYPTSIPKDEDFSIISIAKDIHEIAMELGCKKYSVIGQDWGATVAYVIANLYPAYINKVVALNMPHPKFLKPTIKLLFKARHVIYFQNKKKAPNRLSQNNYAYLDKLYKRWSPNLKYHELKEQMVMCFEREGRKEAALGYYWQLSQENKEAKIKYKELPSVPTLVLVGEQDNIADLGQFRNMESEACFEVYYNSNAGHFLHREEPEYCIQRIMSFLEKPLH